MLKESIGISYLLFQSTTNIDRFLKILINAINMSIITFIPLCRIITWLKLQFNAKYKAAQIQARNLQKRFYQLNTYNSLKDYKLA